MRYAFISDVHSNLEALLAVLNEIDRKDVAEIVCLGDIVGYNANPNECIELISGRGIKCIMGNHDARASGLEEADDFAYLARDAILWTQRQLKQKNISFLKDLPRTLFFHDDKLLAVHGSINSTDEYIFSGEDVAVNFKRMKEARVKICFFGHTHIKMAYAMNGEDINVIYDDNITVEDDRMYLVNPGSIGHPRDGDPRPTFLIYDTDAENMEFFRVTYDIDKCYEKVIKAGLPIELAERLITGY
jgi:diadenosine tetraphosphatase ApaH/serine/threonine PP2A family protein phosphatase